MNCNVIRNDSICTTDKEKCHKEYLEKPFEILSSIETINEKTKKKRKEEIERNVSFSNCTVIIKEGYYARVHELKSYELLKKIGKVDYSADSPPTKGVDLIIKAENSQIDYYVECVKCSYGQKELGEYLSENDVQGTNENGLSSHLYDNNQLQKIFASRITSVLKDKKERIEEYYNNCEKGKNKSLRFDVSMPCIVFVALGELADDLSDYNFLQLMDLIVMGKGTLCYDWGQNVSYYERQKSFNKRSSLPNCSNKDDDEIKASIFELDDYKNISGILFTTANIKEDYNEENTILYVNPRANNRIELEDFEGVCEIKTDQDFLAFGKTR